MKKSFYILVIVSSTLFLISCRAKTESPIYTVEATGPHDSSCWQGTLDLDQDSGSSDRVFYEEQLVALEKRHGVETNKLKTQIDGLQAENEQLRDEGQEFWKFAMLEREYGLRANLLETKIKILQVENQQTEKAIAKLENKIVQLETQIDHRKSWPSFWTELKTEDPSDFQMVEDTLAKFVSEYLYAACYITVADLKAEMREVIVDGEIENTQNLIWENRNSEEENQKTKSEESSQDSKEESCQEEK